MSGEDSIRKTKTAGEVPADSASRIKEAVRAARAALDSVERVLAETGAVESPQPRPEGSPPGATDIKRDYMNHDDMVVREAQSKADKVASSVSALRSEMKREAIAILNDDAETLDSISDADFRRLVSLMGRLVDEEGQASPEWHRGERPGVPVDASIDALMTKVVSDALQESERLSEMDARMLASPEDEKARATHVLNEILEGADDGETGFYDSNAVEMRNLLRQTEAVERRVRNKLAENLDAYTAIRHFGILFEGTKETEAGKRALKAMEENPDADESYFSLFLAEAVQDSNWMTAHRGFEKSIETGVFTPGGGWTTAYTQREIGNDDILSFAGEEAEEDIGDDARPIGFILRGLAAAGVWERAKDEAGSEAPEGHLAAMLGALHDAANAGLPHLDLAAIQNDTQGEGLPQGTGSRSMEGLFPALKGSVFSQTPKLASGRDSG